jgi:hypothetical protein
VGANTWRVKQKQKKAPAAGQTRRDGAFFDIFERDLSPLEKFFVF